MTQLGRRSFVRGAILATALAGPAIARAQDRKGSSDVKAIAGRWKGSAQSAQGTVSVEWTIKEDGSVAAVTGTPDGPRNSSGKMSVRDGNYFYETRASSGVVTLVEEGGHRLLRYDAVFKRDQSRGSAELTAVR